MNGDGECYCDCGGATMPVKCKCMCTFGADGKPNAVKPDEKKDEKKDVAPAAEKKSSLGLGDLLVTK